MTKKKIDMTEWENWCFICKDGGRLLLCDHEGCSKVYHPKCVGKNKSIFKSKKSWTCGKHACSKCSSVAISYSCVCCPYALCSDCYTTADTTDSAPEFKLIRMKDSEGVCGKCLELIRLAEANKEFGPDGKRLDFEDRDTYECRFKEYWEIVKESESLNWIDVLVLKADFSAVLGKRKAEEFEAECASDSDDDLHFQEPILRKRQKVAEDFIGWGSESLVNFLRLLGKDTTKPLSKRELGAAIYEYAMDKDLFETSYFKTQLRIDSNLSTIFKKDDEHIDVADVFSYLDQHLANAEETCYASMVASNMKLVYLRGSLVNKMITEQPKNWERKVVGSFVKVRCEFKLKQVQCIITRDDNNEAEPKLVLVGRERPISIDLLSDNELEEGDLHRSAELCLLRRPTVVETEQKAMELHEDITKDWIEMKLVQLKSGIANEMKQPGWMSRDLRKYCDQIEMLQEPSEQEQLLKQKPPQVIPETTTKFLFL